MHTTEASHHHHLSEIISILRDAAPRFPEESRPFLILVLLFLILFSLGCSTQSSVAEDSHTETQSARMGDHLADDACCGLDEGLPSLDMPSVSACEQFEVMTVDAAVARLRNSHRLVTDPVLGTVLHQGPGSYLYPITKEFLTGCGPITLGHLNDPRNNIEALAGCENSLLVEGYPISRGYLSLARDILSQQFGECPLSDVTVSVNPHLQLGNLMAVIVDDGLIYPVYPDQHGRHYVPYGDALVPLEMVACSRDVLAGYGDLYNRIAERLPALTGCTFDQASRIGAKYIQWVVPVVSVVSTGSHSPVPLCLRDNGHNPNLQLSFLVRPPTSKTGEPFPATTFSRIDHPTLLNNPHFYESLVFLHDIYTYRGQHKINGDGFLGLQPEMWLQPPPELRVIRNNSSTQAPHGNYCAIVH